MDYSIKREPLCVCETVFDGLVEQPVDLDFSLPDYFPDVKKILKCKICPQIGSRDISGDKLYIEGNTKVSLIYLDEEKMSVRCYEHTSPFSISINLKSSVQDAVVLTKTKIEYINCRAVTPRRLDIHGAFSIFAKVKCKKDKDVVCDIEGDGIERKKISVKCNNVVAMGQQIFNVTEVIDKGSRQPEIEHILKTVVDVDLQDYKTLQNKVMITALAKIKVIYISDIEYSTINVLEHTIPVSQVVDIIGVQDNCECDINIDVLQSAIKIKTDDGDENNLLSFECKIAVCVNAYEEKNMDILVDGYSIDYESELNYEKILLSNITEKLNKSYMVKSIIELDDNEILELIDSDAELNNIKCFIKDNKIVFEGKINVCTLAKDVDEIAFYLERLVEIMYEHELDDIDETSFCEENVTLKSCECRIINKNSVEVVAELQINANIYTENKYLSMVDIFLDEEKPKEKDKTAALTIYYADNGEELWDIAKKYGTSVEKIKTENEIDSDKIQSKNMLFIPM